MSLQNLLTALDDLAADASSALESITSVDDLEAQRIRLLGAKNGAIRSVQKLMGALPKEDRPAGGKRFNEVSKQIESLFDQASERLGSTGTKKSSKPGFDPTLPGIRPSIGNLHPITQTIEHLKDIMGRLGFSTVEGPEVEDTWHNFIALNIPEDHPARDPLDNFYLQTAKATSGAAAMLDPSASGAKLLRSQTSTVQIRVMENQQPPLRIISIGRVYRPDEADATHFPMFHQMEGLWIDRNVNMSHLKTVLRLFASSYLGDDVTVRFRPSFFPFTEPSVEVDYQWQDQWIEFGGAGVVDPNVLKHVGYDPEEWSGFAFGLGVERLCMRRYQITDIRDLFRGDVRFLSQFSMA